MKKLMIAFLFLINTVLLYADCNNIRNNAFDPSTPAGQMTYNLLSSDDCKEISEDEKEIKEKERESAVCVILIIVFLMICSTITMLIDDYTTNKERKEIIK